MAYDSSNYPVTKNDIVLTNYMYLYHTDQWILLPQYPDTINDSLGSSFQGTTSLGRTAPVQSYNNSGPREVQIKFKFHRDELNSVNYKASNMELKEGEDYADAVIRQLQAVVLPKYQNAAKSIIPPVVALRYGNEVFIKGVVSGGISITYGKPILENYKYAVIEISFNITEIDPYDAESVQVDGSFRGITKTFKEGIYA